MESWISRAPIPVAEVNKIDILDLYDKLAERSLLLASRPELGADDLPGINEELGVDDLPIRPTSFRIYRNSNRLASRWHFDGSLGLDDYDYLPDIAVFSTSHPTEVLVGEIPLDVDRWWEIGPKDDLVAEALIAGTVEEATLDSNVYYLLQRGTLHRKPSLAGADGLRLFGRWTAK